MAAKTLVGALNALLTMDSSQMVAELHKAGERATAFKVKLTGGFNSISNSVTELSSKLGIVSQLIRGAGVAAGVASGVFKMVTGDLEDFDKGLQTVDSSLRKLPFGLGEVYGMFYDLDILDLGAKARELEEFAKAEEKHNRERIQRVKDFTKFADERARADRMLVEATRERALATSETPEVDKLRNQRIDALEALQSRRDALIRKDKRNEQEIQNEYLRQRDLVNDAFDVRQATLALTKQQAAEEARIAADAKKALEAESKAQSELARKARDEAAQQRRLKQEAARLDRLQQRAADQQERIDEMKSQRIVGATTSISTALGAITIADEAATRAIAQKQLDGILEQTQVLKDIRNEMETVGAFV